MLKKCIVGCLIFYCTGIYAQNAADSLRMSIDDMFMRIESGNRTMIMMRSAKDAADEGILAAKNARLPDIEASLDVSYIGDAYLSERDFTGFTRAGSPHYGNGFAVEARQVIYAGGAIDAGIDIAGQKSELASSQLDKSRQGIRLMAVGEYLDLYRISRNIHVYEENISLTGKLIDEIRAKREQGLALANDITRYELRLETLRLELVRLRNMESVLNYRLCNSLGITDNTVIVPELSSAEMDDIDNLSGWQGVASINSPELRISAINARIAAANKEVVRSERLPQIALVASETFSGPITFELPPVNKNLNIWYIGMGIKYNLGSLYKSSKKLRQAEIQVRQANEGVDVSLENMRNEVQQAYTDWQQAFVELETQKKSLQLATENYVRVHDRYVEQLALITDMLDAFNVKLDAEIGVSDANAEIVYRLCRLKYVAGIL